MDTEFTKEFFDDASAEWRRNKKAMKGGGFAYYCAYIHSNGKNCKKAVEANTNGSRLVSSHPEWAMKSPNPDKFCKQHKRRWLR
jgi:hypothetical protein